MFQCIFICSVNDFCLNETKRSKEHTKILDYVAKIYVTHFTLGLTASEYVNSVIDKTGSSVHTFAKEGESKYCGGYLDLCCPIQ